MTTSPVVSVTDELVAELERSVECVWPETDLAVVTLRALLSERAELLRDAERLEWLIGEQCIVESQNGMNSQVVYRLFWRNLGECQAEWYPSERAAIDAAMQSEAQA